MFSYIAPKTRLLEGHLVCTTRAMVDQALAGLDA